MFIKNFFILSVALPVLIISTILIYFLNLSKNNQPSQVFKPSPPTGNQNTPAPNTPKKPLIIILSPHFDDAALSLGGLLAKQENPAIVATFFTGEPSNLMRTSWDKRSGFSNSHKAATARFKENEQALVSLGAMTRNYGYLDYQYREKLKDKLANQQALERIKSDIIKDIEAIIADNQNRGLLIYPHTYTPNGGKQSNLSNLSVGVYGPAAFGEKITHPDHQILHDAFVEIAKKYSGAPKTNFFIYEDFPYVRQFAQKNSQTLKNFLEEKENLRLEENFIELSEPQISQKIKAISEYRSQVAAFKSMGNDILTLVKKFTAERCEALNPAWVGCEAIYRIVSR